MKAILTMRAGDLIYDAAACSRVARGRAGRCPTSTSRGNGSIRIVVLGKLLDVPEKNLLLRQLQYVSEDVGMGRYCWNAECRYCEVTTSGRTTTPSTRGLACRLRGFDGMRLVKLAPEVRYNMSEALSRAPREQEHAAEGPG